MAQVSPGSASASWRRSRVSGPGTRGGGYRYVHRSPGHLAFEARPDLAGLLVLIDDDERFAVRAAQDFG